MVRLSVKMTTFLIQRTVQVSPLVTLVNNEVEFFRQTVGLREINSLCGNIPMH